METISWSVAAPLGGLLFFWLGCEVFKGDATCGNKVLKGKGKQRGILALAVPERDFL